MFNLEKKKETYPIGHFRTSKYSERQAFGHRESTKQTGGTRGDSQSVVPTSPSFPLPTGSPAVFYQGWPDPVGFHSFFTRALTSSDQTREVHSGRVLNQGLGVKRGNQSMLPDFPTLRGINFIGVWTPGVKAGHMEAKGVRRR